MKCAYVLLDGAAEDPLDALGGKTPLEAARLPTLDLLARDGTVLWAPTIPEGLRPQPEIACLSLLGYDALIHVAGRGAWEAVGRGVPLGWRDVVFLCWLVSTDGEKLISAAPEVTQEEGRALMEAVRERLEESPFSFVMGSRHRHLLIWHDGSPQVRCAPPEDIVGELFEVHLPSGDGEQLLRQLIFNSLELLENHEVNKKRVDEGKEPANMLWLFEPGLSPSLPSWRVAAGMIRADCLSAHFAVRGVCRAAGIRLNRPVSINMDELTPGYENLLKAASELLLQTDFLLLHVLEPDFAAHRKEPDLKVFCLERFDEVFLKPFVERLGRFEEAKLLVACTHKTSSVTGKHVEGAVPLLILPRHGRKMADEFHELAAKEEGLILDRAMEVAKILLDIEVPIR